MTKKQDTATELARLDDVLAVYGADAARWPAGERAGLERLIGTSPEAARLHREAAALEGVMALAPAGRADAALKARIVQAALDGGSRDARVVPLSAARARQERGSGFGSGRTALWPAAALAASFALGLYLGIAGVGTTTLVPGDLVVLNYGVDQESPTVLYEGVLGGQEDLI